jgi:hypothetical protein
MKLRLTLSLVVALLLSALAGTAHAAAPVPIGPGVEPDVEVDTSGTAYIAWIGAEPTTTSLHFCRLPRGAAACAVNAPITTPGTSLTRPFVTVNGPVVRVFSYRYGLTGPRFDAVYMFTSQDGGASFDAGIQVGTVAFYDAVVGPGKGVSLVENNSSVFQRVPADGTGPATLEAHLADDHPYTPSLAITPGAILAVFADGSGAAQFRLQQSGGDPNEIATWTPAQNFSPYAAYMRLATGPIGTFLMSANTPGNKVVQRFNGAGFDPPVELPGPAHDLSGGASDIVEDAAGRLHIVWPFGDANGTHLGYATSDDGSKWFTGTLEAGPNPADGAQAAGEMHAAVAPDHVGVTVWQDSASPKLVHAMAIGPVALSVPERGKTTNATVVKGKVRVKRKGSRKFVTLAGGEQLPLGSTFDTTHGTVALDTAAGAGKPLQHGEFSGGQFTPRQTRKNPLVTLSLSGGGLGKCGRRVPPGGAAKKRGRTLFSNVKGHFRTRGRNSSASARGTKWTMTDSCGGTLTLVRSGTVVVRDFTLRKNKTLRSGQRYFAHAPPIVRRRGNR